MRLRWPFRPACRGKGRIMVLVCACGGLFPLPVEENAISLCAESSGRPWGIRRPAPKTHFPSCLSRKSLLLCACAGLSPLPAEEKAVSWSWCALAMGFSPGNNVSHREHTPSPLTCYVFYSFVLFCSSSQQARRRPKLPAFTGRRCTPRVVRVKQQKVRRRALRLRQTGP